MEISVMSKEETKRLAELEAVIEKDLKGFLRVGMALKEIRDGRLYRGKYTQWKDYLKAEWDISRAYAHRYIAAYDVVENIRVSYNKMLPIGNILPPVESAPYDKMLPIGNILSPVESGVGDTTTDSENEQDKAASALGLAQVSLGFAIPKNEAQARPLTLLSSEQQAEAWKTVLQMTNGEVTALAVNKVVQAILEAQLDEDKGEIQEKITKEVSVPEDFSEQFSKLIEILDIYRKSGWREFKRKKALEYLRAIEEYLKS